MATITGIGTIKTGDVAVTSGFQVELELGKDTILYFDLGLFSGERQKIEEQENREYSFEGELADKTKISISKIIKISSGSIQKGIQMPSKFKVFSNIHLYKPGHSLGHSQRIVFDVVNLAFSGSEKTLFPGGGWVVDHSTLNLDGFSILIQKVPQYDVIVKELRKTARVAKTAEIIVRTDLANASQIREIVNDVCWLLSFATGNSVVPYAETHIDGETVVHKTVNSVHTQPFRSGNHIIPEIPFEALPNFVEETYPQYKMYKKDLGVNVMLNYHELTTRAPILDVKCVLGSVLLEVLGSYAKEYYQTKGEPIVNSLAQDKLTKLKSMLPECEKITPEVIEQIAQEFIYPHPSLPDCINRIRKEFKMPHQTGDEKIFKLRNEFIHNGRFPADATNHVQVYHQILDFIHRLILHILGYTGEYLDYANNYVHKRVIYQT